MTAKVKSMLQCVLVLAAIALVSGLLLGAFHIITYVDPLQSAYDRFAEDTGKTFSKMTDDEGKTYGDGSVIYYALSDDGQDHAFLAEGKGWGGNLYLYVYVKEDLITKVVLGENSETLWGQFEEDFFEQWVGLNITEIDSFEQSDIQTGATAKKTLKGISDAVDAVVQYYKENVAGGQS